mgnify:FL=1
MGEEEAVGKVKHYYPKIGVAVVELSSELKVGDRISIRGSTSFVQTVDSMQIEHAPVTSARPGQSIGLKVSSKVRGGDLVYRDRRLGFAIRIKELLGRVLATG